MPRAEKSTMTPEKKAKLREYRKKKRGENPKPGDYAAADWLVMSDYVKEHHPSAEPAPDYFAALAARHADRGAKPPARPVGCSFRYVPDEAIVALSTILPFVTVSYKSGPGRAKTTRVFPYEFVRRLLAALKLDFTKYAHGWAWAGIKRCRVNDFNFIPKV